jgi:uncharacterized protein (DUF4415 family)
MNRPPLTDKDGEVRELTAEDMKLFRPIAEVDPGMVEAMKATRNKGGRRKVETPKVHFGVRMDPAVAHGIKATGKGYNARVESVLREALAAGKLDAPRDLLGQQETRR